jgi:hypothetical protein
VPPPDRGEARKLAELQPAELAVVEEVVKRWLGL